jgi:PAS domain S-box-containing protein
VLSSYNQASLKFTNEEVKKLIGIKLTEMYRNKPEIINDVFSTYETQMTLQKEMEYTFQSIENVIEMRVTYAFIPPDMILVYTEDITEEKEIERALKEEEAKNKEMYERTQTYLKLVGVMIVVLDRDFNISLINPKGCEILGYSEEELIGKDWLNYVPERIKADILKVRASEVVQTEEIIYHENLILTKEGKERTIGWSNSAHFDEQGEVLFYISSGEDITDKQQNNEKRIFLHRLLRHDVRNKAFIAQSFLDLLLETDLNEEQLTYVQKSKNAVKVTSDLVEKVKDLLNVVEEHEVFDLNLNNLLNKSILINKDLAEEKGIEIIPKIDNEIIVQAGGLLLKLLSNLVENAVKHSHGTMIEISTEITSSNEVKVKVDDNGIGIDPKIKELLFERNVKSKESTGSGLGLYLCKSIIEKYGGKIEFCDSALGGACFSITLMSDKINSRFT